MSRVLLKLRVVRSLCVAVGADLAEAVAVELQQMRARDAGEEVQPIHILKGGSSRTERCVQEHKQKDMQHQQCHSQYGQ